MHSFCQTNNIIIANGDEIAASNGGGAVWSIEQAGDNTVVIKVPGQDLVWTLEGNSCTLLNADDDGRESGSGSTKRGPASLSPGSFVKEPKRSQERDMKKRAEVAGETCEERRAEVAGERGL
ncbi:hypothetical protein P691DRAFT_783048 [Macrolepiota fuliginosa MF-IS2]|uniref:Uncharacterized protein n=1 Tax=Macrolepiota fuliginosa MF-IS2 TaxID=1400762 RepID=A0A9P6C0U2_9AGAR|nr:hypothetical protein P691DRAFT_783048 [Macrolepiota fuliginosa MF-IS2]